MGLVRLVPLVAVLVAIVFVSSAAGSPRRCTHGVSSVGPAVLIHDHLDRSKSNLLPHTEACLTK